MFLYININITIGTRTSGRVIFQHPNIQCFYATYDENILNIQQIFKAAGL